MFSFNSSQYWLDIARQYTNLALTDPTIDAGYCMMQAESCIFRARFGVWPKN